MVINSLKLLHNLYRSQSLCIYHCVKLCVLKCFPSRVRFLIWKICIPAMTSQLSQIRGSLYIFKITKSSLENATSITILHKTIGWNFRSTLSLAYKIDVFLSLIWYHLQKTRDKLPLDPQKVRVCKIIYHAKCRDWTY